MKNKLDNEITKMGTKIDKEKLTDTIGYLNSALSGGVQYTRTMLLGAKQKNQLSNVERARIDDVLIRLRDIKNELTDIQRTKRLQLNALCK